MDLQINKKSDGYSWYVLIACHIYQQLHFLVANMHCYETLPLSSYKRGNQFHNYNSMIVMKFWVSVRIIVFIWLLTYIFSCKYHHYQSFNYDMAIIMCTPDKSIMAKSICTCAGFVQAFYFEIIKTKDHFLRPSFCSWKKENVNSVCMIWQLVTCYM